MHTILKKIECVLLIETKSQMLIQKRLQINPDDIKIPLKNDIPPGVL